MKSFNTPVFFILFFCFFLWGLYIFDYFIFTESLSTPKLIENWERNQLTIFLLSAVNVFIGKDEFFIWQQQFTVSATFTVLQEDGSSIGALVQDSPETTQQQ